MNPLLHRYVRVPVHVPPRHARPLLDAMMHLALRSRIGATAQRRPPPRHAAHRCATRATSTPRASPPPCFESAHISSSSAAAALTAAPHAPRRARRAPRHRHAVKVHVPPRGVTSGDRRFHSTLRSDAVQRAWWCMRARARCAPPVHHHRAWTQ